jgi:hypothetical protein
VELAPGRLIAATVPPPPSSPLSIAVNVRVPLLLDLGTRVVAVKPKDTKPSPKHSSSEHFQEAASRLR